MILAASLAACPRIARVSGSLAFDCTRSPSTFLFLLLIASAFQSHPAFADQNDPRLNALFERIRHTESSEVARDAERKIWEIWLDAGDPNLNHLMQVGVEAMASDQLDLAIDFFSQIIQKSPRFAEGWNKRATAFYLKGELAASVEDIERTLALEPRHFGAVSGMGLIFLSSGDKIGALNAFRRVLEIHPHAEGARAQVRMLEEVLKEEGV
jgi:tetratricopeptide (TPR) repeat protein